MEILPHIDNPKSSADVDGATDTYDTVEWLLKHAESQRLAVSGHFLIQFFTSASINIYPAIKAASPQAP